MSLVLVHTQKGTADPLNPPTFNLDPAGSVDDIEPSRAVNLPMPAGTGAIFDGYQPTSLQQSVNATANFTADFPLSGTIMQEMFAQLEGVHVAGVIALDVPTLASLLTQTGSVSVPVIAGPVSAPNVATVILRDQCYPPGSARRKGATVERVQFEQIDLAALGSALANDVEGRHLIVWDAVPRNESNLTAISSSGSVDSTAPPERSTWRSRTRRPSRSR